MGDETDRLIGKLCTMAGVMMEDVGAFALTIGELDGVEKLDALSRLLEEAQRISTCIEAAHALADHVSGQEDGL